MSESLVELMEELKLILVFVLTPGKILTILK